MFLSIFLLTYSSTIRYITTCVLIFLVANIMHQRFPYVTLKKPTIPIGMKRSPSLKSDDGNVIDFSSWWNSFWIAQSFLIVPYENMVIFIDTVVIDEKTRSKTFDSSSTNDQRPKNYVLSSQEKMHSFIHKKYNDSLLKVANPITKTILNFMSLFYHYSTVFLQTSFPHIVHTMVALQENKMLYERTTNDYFEILPKDKGNKVLNKIFLWHFYEEWEHHQEAIELFREYFGVFIYVLVPLTYPIWCALLYATNIFGWVLFAANNLFNISRLIFGTVELLMETLYCDVTTFFSAFLLFIGASSKDKMLQQDLAYFKKRYLDRYQVDLTQNAVVF